jgi:peptide alpha-N-acetyltransferase
MKLYERLGFLRSKRLHRYYLNGNSAYRLVLYLKEGVASMKPAVDPLALEPQPGFLDSVSAPVPPPLLQG